MGSLLFLIKWSHVLLVFFLFSCTVCFWFPSNFGVHASRVIRDTSAWLRYLDVQHQPYLSGQEVVFEVWCWFWPQTHSKDLWNELCNRFKSDRTVKLTSVLIYQTHCITFVLRQRNFWQKEFFQSKFHSKVIIHKFSWKLYVSVYAQCCVSSFIFQTLAPWNFFPTKL